MSAILLSFVTPYRHLIDIEVDEVTCPGHRGEFTVLPDHDIYLIQLLPGEVQYKVGDEEGHYAIGGGYAEVGPNRVIVLAETAEEAAEIDVARAHNAQEEAERALSDTLDDDAYKKARTKLERAMARLNVAGLNR